MSVFLFWLWFYFLLDLEVDLGVCVNGKTKKKTPDKNTRQKFDKNPGANGKTKRKTKTNKKTPDKNLLRIEPAKV